MKKLERRNYLISEAHCNSTPNIYRIHNSFFAFFADDSIFSWIFAFFFKKSLSTTLKSLAGLDLRVIDIFEFTKISV